MTIKIEVYDDGVLQPDLSRVKEVHFLEKVYEFPIRFLQEKIPYLYAID